MQSTGPGPLTWVVSQNKIWYKLTPFAYNFLVVEKRLLKNLSMLRPQSEYNSLQKVVTKEFRGALYKCREISFFPQPKNRTFMWFKTHSGMSSIGPDHLIMSQQKNSVSFLTICSSSLFQRWIGVSSQIPPAASCASWFVCWIHWSNKSIRHVADESEIWGTSVVAWSTLLSWKGKHLRCIHGVPEPLRAVANGDPVSGELCGSLLTS